MYKIFVICCLSILCGSCGHYPTEHQKEFFRQTTTSKAIESSCRGSDYNRYVVYLPGGYSLQKPFPVLFCFDPHADAHIAISLFKYYAEKHDWVVVASATLQNGLTQDEIFLYLHQLYGDVKDKIWIDTTHIFAVGFSGGARVAALFSQLAPVAGLISCSAGYYPMGNCVPAVSIAGTYDMNYLETQTANNLLNQSSCRHIFLTFEGTHQWPPVSVLSKAIDILQVWRIGSTEFLHLPEGKSQFEKEKLALLTRMNRPRSDSLWQLIEEVNVFLSIYGDVPEIAPIRKSYDSLMQQNAIVAMIDRKIAAEKYEEEQQTIVRQAMGSRPIAWWTTMLNQWQQGVKNDEAMQAVYKRLLAYVSLLSYSYAQAAIRQGNWPAVQYVLTVYGLADPQNADYHYFMACLYTHEHKIPQALEELKNAFHGGIPLAKALNDPLLLELKPYLVSQ
ncbi:MAG TPA: hypothetical protein PLD12_10030 [Bacteroidales bacterium]|nr:hypothetical protein [Bacteroidales bacterium]HPO66335.1 hypothetical protein [Bacteroidales bacterium]